jgi:hypothetical protein
VTDNAAYWQIPQTAKPPGYGTDGFALSPQPMPGESALGKGIIRVPNRRRAVTVMRGAMAASGPAEGGLREAVCDAPRRIDPV